MKQISAVNWLVEQMLVNNYINKKQYENCKSWLIDEAKQLEKEQIIDAGNSCALMQNIHNRKIDLMSLEQLEIFAEEPNITFGEQYYNEKYEK